MLKDRLVLVVNEIAKTKGDAANAYLVAVRSGRVEDTTEYDGLKERLYNLIMDRDIVEQLIAAGHE